MSPLILPLLPQVSAKVESPLGRDRALTALGVGISVIAFLTINKRLD